MTGGVVFRWLGVGGVEIAFHGEVLLIDPFFTRPPLRKLLRRVAPQTELVRTHISRADHLLITHPHYDHLMDAPEVLRLTGAHAHGSVNACALLRALGAAEGQAHPIQVGDLLQLGAFRVEVLPGSHIWLPINRLVNGPLRASLTPPLRPIDYRMDICFSFRIRAGPICLLLGKHPIPADVLITYTENPIQHYRRLLAAVRPQLLIPIHWDNFFRPLNHPLTPILPPPWAGLLRRPDMRGLQRLAAELVPPARLLVPEIFHPYEINPMIQAAIAENGVGRQD